MVKCVCTVDLNPKENLSSIYMHTWHWQLLMDLMVKRVWTENLVRGRPKSKFGLIFHTWELLVLLKSVSYSIYDICSTLLKIMLLPVKYHPQKATKTILCQGQCFTPASRDIRDDVSPMAGPHGDKIAQNYPVRWGQPAWVGGQEMRQLFYGIKTQKLFFFNWIAIHTNWMRNRKSQMCCK